MLLENNEQPSTFDTEDETINDATLDTELDELEDEEDEMDEMGEVFLDSEGDDDVFFDDTLPEGDLDDIPRVTSKSQHTNPKARKSIEEILEAKRLQQQLSDVFEEDLEEMY